MVVIVDSIFRCDKQKTISNPKKDNDRKQNTYKDYIYIVFVSSPAIIWPLWRQVVVFEREKLPMELPFKIDMTALVSIVKAVKN